MSSSSEGREQERERSKRCALCKLRLPPDFPKRICQDCFKENFQQDVPEAMSEFMSWFKVNMQQTLETFKVNAQAQPQASTSGTSQVEAPEVHEVILDSSDEDIREDAYVFSVENIDHLVKAVRSSMDLKDENKPCSKQDLMFLGRKKSPRVFPVHEVISSIISKEWSKPEKKLLLPS
ncbi:hypothetical protein XELAEV_18031200mg [Xenopus laevis]|uniref:Uncharacterized protein n=1 Tax=Xenopus laevis TaxID=8355 RepID=A0A974CMA4_XENLA|nr:hypothetical protein XELAEV_18031200mg [Xenopus laevis]